MARTSYTAASTDFVLKVLVSGSYEDELVTFIDLGQVQRGAKIQHLLVEVVLDLGVNDGGHLAA